jgi:hypothetical protein
MNWKAAAKRYRRWFLSELAGSRRLRDQWLAEVERRLKETRRMNVTYYLGIDPGIGGGCAVVASDGPQQPRPEAQPWTTEGDARDALAGLLESGNRVLAVLEEVHSFPKEGIRSTFTFGTNYGFWRGLLSGLRIPYTLARPRDWQKALGLLTTKAEDRKHRKNRLKEAAQRLFPTIYVTLKTADALLLAELCRRSNPIQG